MTLPRHLVAPTLDELRDGWRQVLARPLPEAGKRQERFLPIETLAAYFASKVVSHRSYGGSTAHTAPAPVPQLADLGGRSAASILAKMANLDMSRPNGAKYDGLWGEHLDGLARPEFADLYRLMLRSAREAGIEAEALPDFLGIEREGEWP